MMTDVLPSGSTEPEQLSKAADISPPAVEAKTGPKMRLTSIDGREFSVCTAAAKVSRTLAGMIIAMGEEEAEPTVAVNLEVDSDTLEAVLEWCERHKGGEPFDNRPKLDAYTHRYEPLELTPWQRTFLSNHRANLWRLAIGANYLDVASLYFAVCYAITEVIDEETTPARIANGEAVVRLTQVFCPGEVQPPTAKKRKTLDAPPSLPFDDAVPDDVLVDVFQFLTHDQLQVCCAALPRWGTVVESKKRLMPREQLRRVTITTAGVVIAESASLALGPSASRSTRSKAAAKSDLQAQPRTFYSLRTTDSGNCRELQALADLRCYSVPEVIVYKLTATSTELFRDFVEAEEVEALRIKHIRIVDFRFCEKGTLLETFQLLGAFIAKIGVVERLITPDNGDVVLRCLGEKANLLPENIRKLFDVEYDLLNGVDSDEDDSDDDDSDSDDDEQYGAPPGKLPPPRAAWTVWKRERFFPY